MTTLLKDQILNRMKAQHLSISALERKAGLNLHSVRNIIKGRIKKPSAHSLQAIAEALECSVLDLINSSSSSDSQSAKTVRVKMKRSSLLNEFNLMKTCFESVTRLVKEKKMSVAIDDYLSIIEIIYFYSISEDPLKVDSKFINWIINNELSEADTLLPYP